MTPTATGGSVVLTTTCAPPSGASFPVGTTQVTCTAVDAMQHTGSCSFIVTVTAPPQTSVTRYVTFGDSITEGFPHTIVPQLLDPAPESSYPAVLLSLLRARYTAQTIAVLDEGIGGELLAAGMARLPGVLGADAPGALLLMEGANDISQRTAATRFLPRSPSCARWCAMPAAARSRCLSARYCRSVRAAGRLIPSWSSR